MVEHVNISKSRGHLTFSNMFKHFQKNKADIVLHQHRSTDKGNHKSSSRVRSDEVKLKLQLLRSEPWTQFFFISFLSFFSAQK
jgi:hypothetical protein